LSAKAKHEDAKELVRLKADETVKKFKAQEDYKQDKKGAGNGSVKHDDKKYKQDSASAFSDLAMSARANGWTVVKGDVVDDKGFVTEGVGDIETILIPAGEFNIDNYAAINNMGFGATTGKHVNTKDGDFISVEIGAFRSDRVGTSPIEGDSDVDYGKFSNQGDSKDLNTIVEPATGDVKPGTGLLSSKGKQKVLTEQEKQKKNQIVSDILKKNNLGEGTKSTKQGSLAEIVDKAKKAITDKFSETKAEQIPYMAEIDGEKVEIPLMVPQQDSKARKHLAAGKPPTKDMIENAIIYAEYRKRKGLPYFREVTK